LITLAGGTGHRLPVELGTTSSAKDDVALYDLRRFRDFAALQRDWLLPAVRALRAGGLESLKLDAADGTQLRLAPGQRWRFWRGAWAMPMPPLSQGPVPG
jgi:hypothetical protein